MTSRDAPAASPSRWRKGLRWVEHVLAVLGAVFLIYHLAFTTIHMESDSMTPTLMGENRWQGDWVLVDKLSYRFRSPRRWEVVLFYRENKFVAKRVAAVPGEKIAIIDDKIVINGVPQTPPQSLAWLKYLSYGNVWKNAVVVCDDGYYVLGDETKDSYDSRFTGVISSSDFIGRPLLRIWPLSRIGWVNP